MSHWETRGESDEWYTPRYIFDALGCVFDEDVAAPKDAQNVTNVPAEMYHVSDSLYHVWNGFIWMNPPFGGRDAIAIWLLKFFHHGNGIALTPDRTSAPWFQDAARKADAILFIDGKVKFIRPDGSEGKSPSTGTALFASGPRGVAALTFAEKNGLGFVARLKETGGRVDGCD